MIFFRTFFVYFLYEILIFMFYIETIKTNVINSCILIQHFMGNNFKKLEQIYNEYFFFHIKHNLLNK